MTPAWHPRPTEPGLWLVLTDPPPWYLTHEEYPLFRLDQEDIDAGVFPNATAVYGPIPEPPQEKP